ncbi:DUF1449 family protein [Fulvivirga maritima]|uniref:OB-fold-containig protein n=1 Tax=Fulvivirga maritima TaxID=2904247 RepID=UPI001F3458A5|nr:OB-fold-containig protein [Fulvivirga maritima]UII27220.1 DUF1449 family protein [Fulvivirga maritima]
MGELLEVAVNPANIIITALSIFIVIYWITVIIGIFDIDVFDFDMDVDVDADADVEVEGSSVIWLNSLLSFFNLGKIPFMIFLSFWIIPTWLLCININYFIGNSSFLIGLFVLFGSLFVGLFITKILTYPFVKLYQKLEKENEYDSIIGKICAITIAATESKTGQAQVKTNGAPHILSVRTIKGIEMQKGDTGLVLEHNQDLNLYLIEPYN